MCLVCPRKMNVEKLVVFKVFAKENDKYTSIFISSLDSVFRTGVEYRAIHSKWTKDYPASFHALLDGKAVIEFFDVEDWSLKGGIELEYCVICEVELSGEIHKSSNNYGHRHVAGTKMKILRECTREEFGL